VLNELAGPGSLHIQATQRLLLQLRQSRQGGGAAGACAALAHTCVTAVRGGRSCRASAEQKAPFPTSTSGPLSTSPFTTAPTHPRRRPPFVGPESTAPFSNSRSVHLLLYSL
jgi:hypothetical protein